MPRRQILLSGYWILYPLSLPSGGQYSSTVLAYEASAMIMDQTQELRDKADSFEKQARHSITHDLLTDMPNKELFYDRVEQLIVSPPWSDRFLGTSG